VPIDVLDDYAWILSPDRPEALSAPSTGPLNINWLIPDICLQRTASGGFLSIFRTIYFLEQWGHKQRVYVVGGSEGSERLVTDLVRKTYFPIRSEIEVFKGTVADSDALVATLWKTAYIARGLANTARKFYFVQDLEHLFYPAGSVAEFAKATYRWGFHGITLGSWIAGVLQCKFGMPCSSCGFSFDREIYSPEGNRYFSNQKNRVLFYARPRTERRGFELGILALSMVAKKMPDTEFVLVGFSERPGRLPFSAVLPGVLSPRELAALYRSCNVALVLSLTNLSLLPLELMASGCAVVSNAGPNVEWLLTEETTRLTDSTPEALAEAILELLGNDQMRRQKVAAGLALANRTSWASEVRKIESAFYQGLDRSVPRLTEQTMLSL
jgi:glycosyltransferase involved in cell wall biosynthesis